MRFMDIIIFIFVINVSMVIVDISGIPDSMGGRTYTSQGESIWVNSYESAVYNESMSGPPGLEDTGSYMSAFGMMIWSGMGLLFRFLFQVILVVPTMVKLGIPLAIATPIGGIMALLQMWGIIQFLRGIGGKSMD